eukprot:gene3068-30004_t
MEGHSQHGMEYTGSSYVGDHVNGRMEGKGTYIFPNGTRYEGEMNDGELHGKGTLYFPTGGAYSATWKHGKAIGPQPSRGEYSFKDGLRYDEGDWSYCDEDDRRFYSERLNGVQPAGLSQLVDKGLPKKIPIGTFDVGDGYYNPDTNEVLSYDGRQLRMPDETEAARITATCRRGVAND